MPRSLSLSGGTHRPLSEGWALVVTAAGAHAGPATVDATAGLPAPVPGTVAQALEHAGLFDREKPQPLHDKDVWYVRTLTEFGSGAAQLRFEGLATVAEVYLNDERFLTSSSMFEAHAVDVVLTGAEDRLAICFRALRPFLDASGPRARWRPQMMETQGLRLVRTTALGHMPGWCPPIDAIGPWRAVSLLKVDDVEHITTDLSLAARLAEGGAGVLDLSFACAADLSDVRLECAGESCAVTRAADGRWQAALTLPQVEAWWPHTHGQPHLYDAHLFVGGKTIPLGKVGFRSLEIDRGQDGKDFAVVVNGERVFCRGAVWTTADIVRLPGAKEDYRPWLLSARDAGMNMLRIGGTMAYETPAFFEICDELGLMVWQDLMFANFDYPAKDDAFVAHVRREVEQLLDGIQASPSLAVLCGGSEIYQQGAMLGLPERIWKGTLTEEILPDVCGKGRADVPYVANSPCGGAMPFSPNEGVTHYYGVGAYCRPLDDARRAQVRFAAESLAFAHVPQARTLMQHLPVPALHHPRWKERVPRDRSASWDFEDIRDFYLQEIFAADPARLRREEPDSYLDLSRAVTAEVVEAIYGEWRRPGSFCNGALVWTLQDLLPGAGWGVIDATGEPKPVWYGLRRAFRPLQVILTDEGTNGLYAHVLNETPQTWTGTLELACLRNGEQVVVSGRHSLTLPPRGKQSFAATDLFGAFFDTTYAFRFGPPSHEVTVARLLDGAGEVMAEAFDFPLGRSRAFYDTDIEVSLVKSDRGWCLDLETKRFAQSLHIEAEGYRAEEDWFHLPPGGRKRIRLLPRYGVDVSALPGGEISHIGSRRIIRF
ncbi:beta-mannosidase [Metarhizobium album]|uniref:Beta-mannosidase n=1 Tax=Metarhizobium album TaxID=2182425 RepID=A0A2U2DR37_9HYPH|nr:glycoside hydrolase family 2 protein [Rhizobium album]PWE55689.1 beta-mannosidase [Rhizobium album]